MHGSRQVQNYIAKFTFYSECLKDLIATNVKMECFVSLPNSTMKIVEVSLKGKGQECMDKVRPKLPRRTDLVSDQTFNFITLLNYLTF